ncbi:hypothetical protein [Halococcus saccharolyticus]|uniref:Twin-arginine translocation signal domain-containing protein n=1 Tax=Halococcus saccharolyticus DSM 5350 TaxID=1227455 RepID=M0MQB2_9EURY|nr:hypothetical protein [Halococcus saccharolyticus]EMA46660.1 hypothetical protein C449_03301 [Halococcus saccharolyticus DSM 5350]
MAKSTRRELLKLTGATAAAAVGVPSVGLAQDDTPDTEWTAVESPTTKTLNGAVDTAEGPFVVGAGGDVLARRKDGWQKVVEYGPQARSRPLTGVDVTDDGKALWFVGGSGVIGEYRVDTETLTNYSAPKEKTSTWEGCAVRGRAGENERLYFVNGSGELLIGVRQESGAVKYEDVTKPGGGSTIPAIDFHARKKGHVVSTSQFVAATGDGGKNWKRIGIDFAGGAFFDTASVGPKDVNVAAGGGIVYRYDGFRWTPHVIDDGRQAIRAIDRDGAMGLAAGSGGKVYERQSVGQWRRTQTPVETKLNGVARTDTYDVAVGAGGTIVERSVDRDAEPPSGNKSVVRYAEGAVEAAWD